MDISYVCVFFAFLLCPLSKIPVGWAMAKEPGGYDNRYPRDQEQRLTGFGKRALGAHLNAFENFPPFAVAVIIAHLTGQIGFHLTLFSVLFLLSRVFYHFLYMANIALLRTLAYGVGLICTVAIFVEAIFL